MMINTLFGGSFRWPAGFILACLCASTAVSLLAPVKSEITPGRIEHRARPYARAAAAVSDAVKRPVLGLPAPVAKVAAGQETAGASGRTEGNVDIYLLARVIYAEGRGEPFEGQVAIGAVLLNRLRDHRFPKSLWQIVFKPGEFCTVRDGQIWLSPDDEALRAARLAAAGWDPTGGALYFYNPAKTTSHWIWSRPVTVRIGRHVFAA